MADKTGSVKALDLGQLFCYTDGMHLPEIRPFLFLLPRDVWLRDGRIGCKFMLWDDVPNMHIRIEITILYRESVPGSASVVLEDTLDFSYALFSEKYAIAEINAKIQGRAVELLSQANTFINIDELPTKAEA